MSEESPHVHPFSQEPVNVSDRAALVTKQGKERKIRKRVLGVVVACSVALFVLLVVVVLALALTASSKPKNVLPDDPFQRAVALLTEFPVIDGHNDLPYAIRLVYQNQVDMVDLTKNGSGRPPQESWHTDIPRLQEGHVGGQFWSAYMGCGTQFKDATRTFIDQIDVIKLFVRKYPMIFQFATSSADIESAHQNGRIASMVGVEGGHAIDSSLGTLRQLYDLGARYMTLTHACNTPWAHSSVDNGTEGLTDFGRKVVREMNRLGMLVDISHVNSYTMMDALETSLAPVIFSHSSSYALCNNARNVPDSVLERLKVNNGIVMVTFVPSFINCADPSKATVSQVADHIDHIKQVAGIDHIGIGSDFDGISSVPVGLEDVSKFPNLFAELIERGYSDDDVMKISRLNLIRVFKDVERASQELGEEFPDNTLISPQPNETCRPDF